MPVRVAALLGAALAVLGALVYLYVAVRADPPSVTTAQAAVFEPSPRAQSDRAAVAADRQAQPDTTDREAQPDTDISKAAAAPPAMPSEPTAAPETSGDPNQSLPQAMDEANRFYDRQEFDSAQEAALKILERSPGNVRMLRIVVSTACVMGEPDKAQRYWTELPERDRVQMSARCSRVGVAFKE